jgi:DNA-binding transcriptional ArsR family regulator
MPQLVMTPETAARSFQAMGSEARMKVLQVLIRAGAEGLAVGEIQARTGIAASTLSHHIRVLAEAGVIEQRREGRTTVTRAAYGHLRALAGYILSECCADALADHHAEATA